MSSKLMSDNKTNCNNNKFVILRFTARGLTFTFSGGGINGRSCVRC